MSLGFNLAQEGSFFPLHLLKILHFADFCGEESLTSKHTLVHCKSWGYNPFHERYSCILINGAHFHTVIALLVPALVVLINFSPSETCRIGKTLKMVNTYIPEKITLRLTKNYP